MKWEESGTETSRPAIRIRLGWRAACQGTLTGGQQEKCLHSCENVTERSGIQESSAAARQPDSIILYEQSGQNCLHPGHNNGERPLVVVPTEGYPTDGTTSTRSGENEGRHRVESDEGSLQLDVEPVGLSTNQGTLSVPGGQSICHQIDIPATPISQLETRPSNRSDKRLSPKLGADERIRKSSMNLVGSSLACQTLATTRKGLV